MTFPLAGTGVWSSDLRYGDPAAAAEAAAELESLGYTAAWLPDVGGDLFGALRAVLEGSESLVAASGILNLWMHSPEETTAAYAELVAAHGPRLLLGIGVSHAILIDGVREEGAYRKPYSKMVDYLAELDAQAGAVPHDSRVLAALGPKMLRLAHDQAGGVHPYLVTPEHTRLAREAVGPDRLVAPEQAVVLEADPDRARAIAREHHLSTYAGLPNYANNWKRFGFTDADLEGNGSDRLVDALVAWGDEEAIAARVQEHRDAGADHVCVQVITDEPGRIPLDEWRRLAPALV